MLSNTDEGVRKDCSQQGLHEQGRSAVLQKRDTTEGTPRNARSCTAKSCEPCAEAAANTHSQHFGNNANLSQGAKNTQRHGERQLLLATLSQTKADGSIRGRSPHEVKTCTRPKACTWPKPCPRPKPQAEAAARLLRFAEPELFFFTTALWRRFTCSHNGTLRSHKAHNRQKQTAPPEEAIVYCMSTGSNFPMKQTLPSSQLPDEIEATMLEHSRGAPLQRWRCSSSARTWQS